MSRAPSPSSFVWTREHQAAAGAAYTRQPPSPWAAGQMNSDSRGGGGYASSSYYCYPCAAYASSDLYGAVIFGPTSQQPVPFPASGPRITELDMDEDEDRKPFLHRNSPPSRAAAFDIPVSPRTRVPPLFGDIAPPFARNEASMPAHGSVNSGDVGADHNLPNFLYPAVPSSNWAPAPEPMVDANHPPMAPAATPSLSPTATVTSLGDSESHRYGGSGGGGGAPNTPASLAAAWFDPPALRRIHDVCLRATTRYLNAHRLNRALRTLGPCGTNSAAGSGIIGHMARFHPYPPEERPDRGRGAGGRDSFSSRSGSGRDRRARRTRGGRNRNRNRNGNRNRNSSASSISISTSSASTGTGTGTVAGAGAIPRPTGCLLSNASAICHMLWRRARRDRADVLGSERDAVGDMAQLLAWAETVVFGAEAEDDDDGGDDNGDGGRGQVEGGGDDARHAYGQDGGDNNGGGGDGDGSMSAEEAVRRALEAGKSLCWWLKDLDGFDSLVGLELGAAPE